MAEQQGLTDYRGEDGTVGIRNYTVILPMDKLSNAAAEAAAKVMPGTLALPHDYGWLQFGPDLDLELPHSDRHRIECERSFNYCHRQRTQLDRTHRPGNREDR